MLGIEGFSIDDGQGAPADFEADADVVGLDYNIGDHPEIGVVIRDAVELEEIASTPPYTYIDDIN